MTLGALSVRPESSRRFLGLLVACLCFFATSRAHAETVDATGAGATTSSDASEPPKLYWQWRKSPPLEYVATGLVGVGALGVFFLLKPQATPHWNSGILFDNAVRKTFRLHSPSGRDAARTFSNVTAITTLVLAVGVDSVLLPLVKKSPNVIEELLLIDAEALALNSLATTITFDEVGRARPSYDDCKRNRNVDPLCNSGNTASFFSGHESQAFTAAGLSCAHHQYLKFYGGGAPDTLSCIGNLTVAAGTGALRILGDRHYATDVLTGALVGFGFGYGMPVLLHYSFRAERANVSVVPFGRGLGIDASGTF
ncbi:MAG TPA: phosphatase PAP2 family protein [Polyangiaceae bacterium]|nr:phosphatase PAP2 family protein [Polyangiaceae bacterium]